MATRLVILGSAGGPLPKPGRNAASHALVIDGRTHVIDCGNGVAAQLVRAGIALSSLKRIYITHHHIDHVADFGMLLHLSWSQLREPVELVGPPPIARMLELYLELYAVDIESRMADEKRPHLRELIQVTEITDEGVLLREPGLTVHCARVEHPPLADVFAYRFDSADGVVVFSADTVPSQSLARLARGADVLIHEALYLDDAAEHVAPERLERLLARMLRAHSSAEGAGEIARQAGARTLVLSPLGLFGVGDDARLRERAASTFGGDILVGHDLLSVELPLAHAPGPA